MRIVIFSDVHDLEVVRSKQGGVRELRLPTCDLALFCGDSCNRGTLNEWKRFCEWYGSQEVRWKVAIGGNHDGVLQHKQRAWALAAARKAGIVYLQDSGVAIEGIKIWGSPWTPYFGGTEVFHQMAGSLELKAIWDLVPLETDILLTHGPARGVLDKGEGSEINLGDELLGEMVKKVQPSLHACGHVHSGRGMMETGKTLAVNACLVDQDYRLVHEVVTLEMELGKTAIEETLAL